jgi:hypothetical protein
VARLPNLLYIGTAKAGSTWIYDVLAAHPDVHMAPGKGLYFFTSHYERGLDWYRAQFAAASGERVVGEVSHTYLYDEKACERAAAAIPDARLIVCLREPVDRAFSDYLDAVKNGRADGPFEELIERDPDFLELGRYARYLEPWLVRFGRERIHVGIFDDLSRDPERFAVEMFRFLDVAAVPLAPAQRKRMMPAGRPRSHALARLAKTASHAARALGLRSLRGRLKRSRALRNVLYRPYAEAERPVLRPETRDRLRESYRNDVRELDALLGGSAFRERWGYE